MVALTVAKGRPSARWSVMASNVSMARARASSSAGTGRVFLWVKAHKAPLYLYLLLVGVLKFLVRHLVKPLFFSVSDDPQRDDGRWGPAVLI